MEYYTTAQLADNFNVRRVTILKWIRDGKLNAIKEYYKNPGGIRNYQYVVHKNEVKRFIEHNGRYKESYYRFFPDDSTKSESTAYVVDCMNELRIIKEDINTLVIDVNRLINSLNRLQKLNVPDKD